MFWLKIPDNHFDMNPIFHQYNVNYISHWTLILLFIGVFILLKRRKNEDLVVISALITIYAMFHMSSFGLISEGSYRIARFLMLETYFFYAAMAVALVSIPSFFKIPKTWKKNLRIILVALFLLALVFTQGSRAYHSLKGAYSAPLRITPAQYELAEWVQENVPEESALQLIGTLTYPKKGFIQILSRRSMLRSDEKPGKRELIVEGIVKEGMVVPEHLVRGNDWVILMDYAIFDYSDLILINDREKIETFSAMEKNISNNATMLYNKNNIRVYKFD